GLSRLAGRCTRREERTMSEDFRRVAPDELELVRSCGPNERCVVFGDEFVKTTIDRIESMYEEAFRTAYTAALELAGDSVLGQTLQCEIEDMAVGQTYMRVT